MLIFLDTEFTDFIDCDLISIGMISDDGTHELYLEVQDFDRTKCSPFVQMAVLPQLGKQPEAVIRKADISFRLREWFATLPESVSLACDSTHDKDLLDDALDGDWPANLGGWYDLRGLLESVAFNQAVASHHSPGKSWHHALFDAQAHRAGWLAWTAEARQNA